MFTNHLAFHPAVCLGSSFISSHVFSNLPPTPRLSPSPTTACIYLDPDYAPPLPPPLCLKNLTIDPPVILAPMAGVTNYPFRKMCATAGAGLCVSEMLLAKNVADGKPDGKARFGPTEAPRSAQLYGTSAPVMAAAAERLIASGVEHIDLNFGCPAPKVIKKGGGAAIAADLPRLDRIVRAVVAACAPHNVPVTAKIRMGLRYDALNYREAGRVLQDAGVDAVILHARTAADGYAEGAGRENWIHVAALAHDLDIPVLANGDIFTAADALRALKVTGAAGVVIGRGCLGRPWLFGDIADAFRTNWASETTVPQFRVVAKTMMEHLMSAVAWQAADGVSEKAAVTSMRKWFGWYWKGYNGLPELWVPRMCKEVTVAGVAAILAETDPDNVSYSYNIVVGSRGKRQDPLFEKAAKRPDPELPPPPKKSASQRLPSTEKGWRQKEARDAIKEKEYQDHRERVLEFRRKNALPRRRAKAVNVQNTMKAGGKKINSRTGKVVRVERKKTVRDEEDDEGAEYGEESSESGFVEASRESGESFDGAIVDLVSDGAGG